MQAKQRSALTCLHLGVLARVVPAVNENQLRYGRGLLYKPDGISFVTTLELFPHRLLSGLTLVALLLISAPRLDASCNQIPGPTNTFRGAHGTIDRPFASPADPVDLRLSPTCDANTSFDVPQGLVISVIFTPLDGPRNIVVMAPTYAGLENDLAVCAAQAGVSKVTPLVTASPAAPGQVLDPLHLRFFFPNTDRLLDASDDARTLSGPATIAVTAIGAPLPCGLATTPCTQHPETLACIDALYAVDGTCGTAPDPVFSHFTALPLPNDYSALCSDPIPPCTAQASELRLTIDSVGNVLLPIDWSGILVFNQTIPVERLLRGGSAIPAFPGGSEPIRIPGSEFLQSFSPEGSLLAPTFEPQSDPNATREATFFGTADATRTVLRLARRAPGLTACTGGGNDGRPCAAAADCPGDTCGTATCTGGANAGQACHADSDCSGGECGPSLFDFRSRVANEAGLGLIPHFGPGVCQDSGLPCTTDASCRSARCIGYRMVAEDAVPLDGLIESPDLRVTVVPEAIQGHDLDGDDDAKDEVLLLANRHTGVQQSIGVPPARGRAVTRVHAEPFSSPAVAVEGDIVAYLEGEPLQGNVDVNGDGDVFDTPLRIFRSGDQAAEDLLPAPPVMANAAPVINGASVVVSKGLVFVRVSEMDAAHRTIVRASVSATGGDANGASGRPSLSKDARQVAFESTATNLIAPPLAPSSLAPSPSQGEGWGEVGQVSPISRVSEMTLAAGQSRLTSYVVDLRGGGPQTVQLDWPNVPPAAAAIQPWLSGDGRYVAVAARDSGGVSQIFVYDRDHDGNGVFDEPGGTATVMMSQSFFLPPRPGIRDSLFPFITSSGRFVTFGTYDVDTLTPQFSGAEGVVDVVDVDRDHLRTGNFDDWERDDNHDGVSDGVRIDLLSRTISNVGDQNSDRGPSDPSTLQPPSVSEDGNVATFVTFDHNLANGSVTPDQNDFCLNLVDSTPSCADVLVRGPDVVGQNRLVSYSTAGQQANNQSLSAMLSNDGRSVVYTSAATNLVPGDTNGAFDIFVNDVPFIYDGVRSTTQQVSVASDSPYGDGRGTTTRVSVASDGTEANGPSFDSILGISDEGRYVAFASTASNLVPGDTNNVCDNNLDGQAQENCSDIFIHDRATGFTQRLSVAASGAEGNGASHHAALSGDGRTLAFESTASNLVPNDHNDMCDNTGDGVAHDNCSDVFVAGPDRNDPAADFNSDGDASDTLLEVFDTRQAGAAMSVIAPAGQVAIVGERAAFLSPEQDSETDLNGDGDTKDSVVQLYTGRDGRVINLQRAARSVALSERWVAALVSEADEERDLDGDGKLESLVVQVTSADGTEPWTNLGISATRVDLAGDTLAFTRIEDRGRKNQSGYDVPDVVLKLYDLTTGTLINTDQAAEEFVLIPDLIAFRTSEAMQRQDLNGDGDTDDFVMQVYDMRTRRLINTGQAAIPCASETCDPRRPYTLTPDSVTFLTLEGQQGQDLNGDGSMDDLVLQTFNIAKALAAQGTQPVTTSKFQRSQRQKADGSIVSGVLTTIGVVSVGICSDTGNACSGATDCGPAAHCYLPPGGCVTNLHTACDTTLAVSPCGEHQFCVPTSTPGRGECHLALGSCTTDAECTAPAQCQATGQRVQRLISPLFTATSAHVAFTTAGADGRLAVVRAGDTDGDGIADPFDNCPHVANADQADANGNGVGDACEASAAAPTPTAVPTSAPSPAPVASSTSAPRRSAEGCAVDPKAHGSVAYMVLLGACVLWAMRLRRAGLLVALAVAIATAPAAPTFALGTTATCAGDCDSSGTVTVDELVTLVNIALGADPTQQCAAGDLDGDGSVTVDEILAAVGRAMSSCPVSTEALAGGVTALAHALSYLPFFEPVLSAFFSAAGGAGDCPSGGSLTSTCDDSGAAMIRIPIVAAQCAIPTIEGTVTLDGAAPLTGTGLCPSVLVPGGWQMAVHSGALLESPAATTLFDGQFDLAATIQSLGFGESPCRLRGGAAILDGSMVYRRSDGGQVTVTADALNASFVLRDFSLVDLCQPATIGFTLDGDVGVAEERAQTASSIGATLQGLTVTIHRLTGLVEISGGVAAQWIGGNATLATATSLVRPMDQPCFTGGTLNVDASGVRSQLTFGSGGSVTVDQGTDGSNAVTFGSCLDAGLRTAAVSQP